MMKKNDKHLETGNRKDLIRYINLKLASMGQPIFEFKNKNGNMTESDFVNLAESLVNNYKEKTRLLSEDIINPSDERIQNFINDYFKDIEFKKKIRIPFDSFVLDKKGLGRVVSLPPDKNEFFNEYIKSYRIRQGVLHNPMNDRRTTKGSFHIVKGGLPVPPDKLAVPKIVFVNLLYEALNPPDDLMILPFTSTQKKKAKVFTSLLLRPIVSPEVPGYCKRKTMEVRFFAPGSLVSSLDFVESIFGNAGDAYLYKNDAGLDIEHWTGHTGCIILAPHLTKFTKRELGLPHYEDASEDMRADGMCWKDKDELYNGGSPFKITCRDSRGVIVTIIADNYFGYSKKEIKTQLSYATNLMGLCEEEHAGGAIAFPRWYKGSSLSGTSYFSQMGCKHKFDNVKKNYKKRINFKKDNYGIDRKYNNIIYIPENAELDIKDSSITWEYKGDYKKLKILKDQYYILPNGDKITLEKHPFAPFWYLVLTSAEGSFCHKPSTVSGGGKSEISKSLLNAIIYAQFHVDNFHEDVEILKKIVDYDYSKVRENGEELEELQGIGDILNSKISIGSSIKLMTPENNFNQDYKEFIQSIPEHVKAMLFILKIHYHPEDGETWEQFFYKNFNVDFVNGRKGHALLYQNRKIVKSFLRTGFDENGSWFVYSLRPDFMAASKLQMEDDITASITLPAKSFKYVNEKDDYSLKFVENCESLFFQRPDEAINRGYDKQAESDLSKKDNFTTNYEPLTPKDGKEIIDDAIAFDKYTEPIKELIKRGAEEEDLYFITPAHPRILKDGTRSKNPRYLQVSPDFSNPIDSYLAHLGIRLRREIPDEEKVYFPVDSVLPGRRNNPADKEAGIKALSVYNPIHYQEYPELFMDFVCSLTGKSPSTTGAGSEGALTKGPFNMLVPTTDLNNALISYILCDFKGFSSAAGYIGHKYKFEHDISILIPELWCRLREEEKDPEHMIKNGLLEKIEDIEYKGKKILSSRLGYRINKKFVTCYLGKVFEEPSSVFNEEILKPEKQSLENFVEGVENIVEAQRKAALLYFEDGSVESAIPPLKAILHIMAYGHYKGKDVQDEKIRNLFTREYVLRSSWYKERLLLQQERDLKLWQSHKDYLLKFQSKKINNPISRDLHLDKKLKLIDKKIKEISSSQYLKKLKGTIGADPLFMN